ncbi:MAG: substrate-binding domain-containing protein [Oscillospiraceae bacterium]|jgi:tungstate transport system substrate-binding protein|nr:substrate-binding domain-containing protein [Oscillospiraceae bacterium]
MKKTLALLLSLLLAFSLFACGEKALDGDGLTEASTTEPVIIPENPVIRLSTTTSVNDSGLLPAIVPVFEAATGYTVEITSAGSGAAIEKGRTGDADLLLVHSKASEEEFLAEGWSPARIPFMYNYFVIVGPANDPAGVASATSASEALKKIAESSSTFISRGDDSGTHKAELKIWDTAGITPAGDWYVSAGQGMGAVLNMAAEQQAYTLTDKATYLAHEQKSQLAMLLEKNDELKNTYSLLAISPEKWPDTNIAGAQAFIEWITSAEGYKLIDEYGVNEYGEQLFFTMPAESLTVPVTSNTEPDAPTEEATTLPLAA